MVVVGQFVVASVTGCCCVLCCDNWSSLFFGSCSLLSLLRQLCALPVLVQHTHVDVLFVLECREAVVEPRQLLLVVGGFFAATTARHLSLVVVGCFR